MSWTPALADRCEQARTLPGHWYADPAHHALEMDRVFGRQWVGVAGTDAVEKPGSYLAATVAGGVPVLVVRGDDGELRAFLNVCRHRGAPVAEGCGTARALSCPYHAWVYRLDGTLARSAGVGEPDGFDIDDFGLTPIGVTTFARSVMVNLDPAAAPFDPGPLVDGLAPYRLDDLELGRTDRYEAAFNWKVLVENYSENYHTPFVHSQLIGAGYEYPMATTGDVVFAWDRPLAPRDPSEEALASSTPGGPGWDAVAGDVVAGVVQQRQLPHRLPQHDGVGLRRLRGHVPLDPHRAHDDGRGAGLPLAPLGRPGPEGRRLRRHQGGRAPGPRDL